jgi:peptidoglycan/LPS O-acetylase OafA/YrhL
LIFAMLLTFALDVTGKANGWGIYESRTAYPLINTSIQSDLSAGTAAGNLAFLMNAAVPCFGTNGPLWSLHFEWWFYMIYPLLWLLARRSLTLATVVVGVAFAASWFAREGVVFYVAQVFAALLTWWIGALLAEVYAGRLRIAWGRLAPLALLLPTLPYALPFVARRWPAFGQGWAADTLYGLGFAGVFALCFLLRERGWTLRALSKLRPLGDMSYTLYVIHLPLLVFLSAWLMARSPGGLLPKHFGWFAVGSVLCVLLAWGAHFAVERPFLRRKSKT